MLILRKSVDHLKIVFVVRKIQKLSGFCVVAFQRILGKCKSEHYFDGFEELHYSFLCSFHFPYKVY